MLTPGPSGPCLRKPRVQQLFQVPWVLLLVTEPVSGTPEEVFMERMVRTEGTVRTSAWKRVPAAVSCTAGAKREFRETGACPAGEGETAGDIRGQLGPDGLEPRRPPRGNSTFTPRREALQDPEE